MASLNGEDDLTYLRDLWNEMRGSHIDTRHVDAAAIPTPRFVITDERHLYDKLNRATPLIQGSEKRSDIGALSLRENLERGQGQ